MKKISILLIALGVLSSAFAKDFTRGRGKFKASDDDSYEFIKKQLVHEGFKDIITKELTALGLSPDLFWQKYNESLNSSFAAIENDLKIKYKIDENKSRSNLDNYERELRRKKLLKERSFGGLNNIIPRWVVKKITRSQQYPRNRYIQLEGDVDKTKLNQIYYSFVKGKQSLSEGTLYVKVSFELKGFTYTDIGIDNERAFDGVITKKWLEWFLINKPVNISNVVLVEGNTAQDLKNFQSLPTTEMLSNIPEKFRNSLLLDLNLRVILNDSNPELNIYEYDYYGQGYLKNLQSNTVVDTYKMLPETKEYRLSKSSNLANIIANHVYSLAKGYFPKVTSSIKNITPVSSVQRVSLKDFKSVSKLHDLLAMVNDQGVRYSLRTEIESIAQGQADVIFFYDGKLDQIKGLLNQVKVEAAKNGLAFEVVDTAEELGIKFKGESESEKI